MGLQGWDKNYREQLKIQEQEIESLQEQLMISGATGQGGSPGQLYKPPVTNPGRGEAVFGTGKDGQRFFEFLKAMQINPNDRIADISQFDSFMDRFKKGSPNPKYPSLNHHSPEAQKLILNTALRIRGV